MTKDPRSILHELMWRQHLKLLYPRRRLQIQVFQLLRIRPWLATHQCDAIAPTFPQHLGRLQELWCLLDNSVRPLQLYRSHN